MTQPLKPFCTLLVALSLLVAASAPAAAKSFVLSAGDVSFDVPDTWPVIMQKRNGDPQFYAFQVPNPDAGNTLTHVTVTTHKLKAVTDFDAYVQQRMHKARKKVGFHQTGDMLASKHSLHYAFDQGTSVQNVRLSIFQHGRIAVVLRCQRPDQLKASSEWLAEYRAQCRKLARQLDL